MHNIHIYNRRNTSVSNMSRCHFRCQKRRK